MACTEPIVGFRAPDGRVVFNHAQGWIDRPVTVACGRCTGCRLERSRQWAVRIMHEATLHDRSCFLTLTYDDEHLPASRSLDVCHWQKFAKRVRRRVGPFRFFHCGEYGDLRHRPHYHACVFGIDFHGDRILEPSRGFRLFSSAVLDELWGMGSMNRIGDLTFLSAAYVARYCLKKVTGKKAAEHYERVDPDTGEVFSLKPEYTTMSRRPGIGSGWFRKWSDDVFPRDYLVVRGVKAGVPKFYDGMYEVDHPVELEAVKGLRVQAARARASDNTWERLRVKGVCTDARLALYCRDVD